MGLDDVGEYDGRSVGWLDVVGSIVGARVVGCRVGATDGPRVVGLSVVGGLVGAVLVGAVLVGAALGGAAVTQTQYVYAERLHDCTRTSASPSVIIPLG